MKINRRMLKLAWIGLIAAAMGPQAAHPLPVSRAYEQVNPSVVVIHTVERGRLKSNPRVTSTEIGLGSGVVVSAQGHVLTAAHVVQVADAVEVKFLDGPIIPARILGTVVWADVALLQLERVPDNLVVADTGDSDAVRIGDQVFIIGAPRNLEHTLTVGYISGKRRSALPESPYGPEFLQTDAAINEGNSGGPMFTMEGKLVGIVSQFITVSGGSEGLGLTTAVNVAQRLLLQQEPFWLGAEWIPLNGPLSAALNVPQITGLLIQRIARGSPAHRAGFEPGRFRARVLDQDLLLGGDVILTIQGQPISDNTAVVEERYRRLMGKGEVRFDILRQGRRLRLRINLGEAKSPHPRPRR